MFYKYPKGTRRFNILGVSIDAVNMEECLRLFEEIIASGKAPADLPSDFYYSERPYMTTALGVAGIIEARRKPALQRILNQSVLNTPDGIPLVWLGRWFGHQNIRRVYGPDLLREVCSYGVERGWRHFFYGAAPGVVEKLSSLLKGKYPDIRISGGYCPPFRSLKPEEQQELVEKINTSDTDIFWIGISTPKQLYFMNSIRSKLNCRIICPVGYAFDVNAGKYQDAPDWVKSSGFQWLHRALKQPRLWKRYLPDNPRFIFSIVLQLLRLKKYPMYGGLDPTERFNVLGVGISEVNMDTVTEYLFGMLKQNGQGYVCVTGSHGVMEAFKDERLKKIHNRSLLTVPDGIPLVWLGRMCGIRETGRVYGPDLMLKVFKRSIREQKSHFLFGATNKTLEKLKDFLLQTYPGLKIRGMYAPPFRPLTVEEETALQYQVAECRPDFFWVGLSTPKQERFMMEHSPNGAYPLKVPIMIGVGAAFDIHAGNITDAPSWIKNTGLQWLYRLCIEPRRLWKRYSIVIPSFIWHNFLQRLKIRKYEIIR